jgi:hypothetical protein
MARNSIIRISFDSNNVWNREDFREFLHSVQIDDKVIIPLEFYLITESTNTAQVTSIGEQASIDSANVYQVTNYETKLTKLQELGIDIHFDAVQGNIKYIQDNDTSIKPILVNWLKNQNGLMKYIEVFRRVLNDFNNAV